MASEALQATTRVANPRHAPSVAQPESYGSALVSPRFGVIGQLTYLQRTVGNHQVAELIQRRPPASHAPVAEPAEITDTQADAAVAWAQHQDLGEEAIRELQTALNVQPSGVYDRALAAAVFLRQRQWQPHGHIGSPGKATESVFSRLGLIVTHTIHAAAVDDAILQQLVNDPRNANGVTVALYSQYGSNISGAAEFPLQAGIFARNQGAIGLHGGAVALNAAIPIVKLGDVIESVQSIHRGLLDKHTAAQAQIYGPPAPPPAWTRIANLAIFTHGEKWGMGLNAQNAFMRGGLHATGDPLNPPNVQAFVRGLSEAVSSNVRVQLFACLTGGGAHEMNEWGMPPEDQREGAGSFASTLAGALGPDASVYAHTTAGHTTENFAARIFGHDAGGGPEGAAMFNVMYPSAFVDAELARLFSNKTDEERAQLRNSLRHQMWNHFRDSVAGEHQRPRRQKRYPVPMGQETFVNPDHARALLQADWTSFWIPRHLREVTPPRHHHH